MRRGRVTVNGKPSQPGQIVNPAVDRILVDGRPLMLRRPSVYVVMNKPAGILTTVRDDRRRKTVLDALPGSRAGIFPVGRLDFRSRGLVLLTDDGELGLRLTHPRYHVEKEYEVVVAGRPTEAALTRMRRGMGVESERFAPAQVRLVATTRTSSRFRMVLTEGRKREIRRMFAALGHPVIDLVRVRMGPLRLGRLASGSVRPLNQGEIANLRRAVGLHPLQ